MTRTGRLLWAAAALALLLLLVWPLLRGAEQRRRLEPVAAWVAIERGDSGVAEVGPLALEAGEPFTLHAVLEGHRGSQRVFFTDARRLRIAGVEIEGEDVQPWAGDLEARVLWFTVEPQAPVVRWEGDAPVLRYQANFRSDWPRAWRAPGRVEPYRRRLMAADERLEGRFGTQHFQVRIELFGPQSEITPVHRVVSAGPDELLAAPESFPTATARLPGPLAPASAVFGLPQVVGDLDAAALEQARRWQEAGLAFSLPVILRETAARAGGAWQDLAWSTIDLADGPAWGAGGVAPGDLVRVAGRVVVLYRDEGEAGVLDGDDLCFDFQGGATVERLGEVFTGEGLVEWGVGREGGGE